MSVPKEAIRKILRLIVLEGKIDAEQVEYIDAFLDSDKVIDQREAKLLFRINHALESNHDDCKEWIEFFVESICRYCVMDMNSPGQIDQEEGDWLGTVLDEYSVDNLAEQRLIREIQQTTTSIAGKVAARINK